GGGRGAVCGRAGEGCAHDRASPPTTPPPGRPPPPRLTSMPAPAARAIVGTSAAAAGAASAATNARRSISFTMGRPMARTCHFAAGPVKGDSCYRPRPMEPATVWVVAPPDDTGLGSLARPPAGVRFVIDAKAEDFPPAP